MLLIRLVSAVYWSLLTLLLLVPEPARLLGLPPEHGGGGRGTHFLFFLVLPPLIGASRLPMRRGVLAVVLVSYAFLTEGLQTFFPPRQVELLDLIENLLGLLGGGLLWQVFQAKAARLPSKASADSLTVPGLDSSSDNS